MLLFITPNPCIERTLCPEDFVLGGVHRVTAERVHVQAGGKALNAARVAHRLGQEVLCSGWIGRAQLDWFSQQMAHENLPCDWIEVEADTRVCINILSEADGAFQKTELVEAGEPLSISDGTRLLQKVESLLSNCAMMVIGGSYPPAQESAFEAHAAILTRLASRFNCKVLYDGKGSHWIKAIRSPSPPWCITPNLEEASALLRRELRNDAEERRAIGDILRRGVEVVLLTCGERGAWLGTRDGTIWLPAPKVHEVSPVGSGDSLVGAFCATYHQNTHLPEADRLLEAARWGVAAGAANAAQIVSAHVGRDEIAALVPHVQPRQVQQMLPML
ncbi:MAG: tagatose 6-phosphate kinase [Abditibacteriota bacterium]|nr:tagatose 6-phosphate kinase [Abditibacteriota bacterium]